jgi:hypothetical protein
MAGPRREELRFGKRRKREEKKASATVPHMNSDGGTILMNNAAEQ